MLIPCLAATSPGVFRRPAEFERRYCVRHGPVSVGSQDQTSALDGQQQPCTVRLTRQEPVEAAECLRRNFCHLTNVDVAWSTSLYEV